MENIKVINMNKLVKNVQAWFVERNLHTFDGTAQLEKLKEEVQELLDARANNDVEEEIDAVGDITVVLIGYCMQRGFSFAKCLYSAYNVIKDRKGKVINGTFVKEEDLERE